MGREKTLPRVRVEIGQCCVKTIKNGFLKYVHSKKRFKENIEPKPDEAGHLTNGDEEKAEAQKDFFESVFSITIKPWGAESLSHRAAGTVVLHL